MVGVDLINRCLYLHLVFFLELILLLLLYNPLQLLTLVEARVSLNLQLLIRKLQFLHSHFVPFLQSLNVVFQFLALGLQEYDDCLFVEFHRFSIDDLRWCRLRRQPSLALFLGRLGLSARLWGEILSLLQLRYADVDRALEVLLFFCVLQVYSL